MIRRTEDKGCTQRSTQSRPEFRRKSSIEIGDQRVGEAHVSKYRAHEVGGGRGRGNRLERWDKPDAPRPKFDVHLQKIMPGFCDRHLQEVQNNHSAPARRHGKRERKASRATMLGFDAPASWQVLMNVSTSAARKGHQTERWAKNSVLSRPK